MDSTCEVSASLTISWPPEDYWRSSQGQRLTISNTFIEREDETSIDQGRPRARSDTVLDDMMDEPEGKDNLQHCRTCSTEGSNIEDEQDEDQTDEDTELGEDKQDDDECVDRMSVDSASKLDLSPSATAEVNNFEEFDSEGDDQWFDRRPVTVLGQEKEEDIENQRVLTTQGENMGPCVPMMGSPNIMQQTNSSPPMMMGPAACCFYVPASSSYPDGVGMEQATQRSVDAYGYPQFMTSPCSSACRPPHESAKELNARAAELHLAAWKCTAAAQQMAAAANSQGTPSQVAFMQSARKQPSWRTARPPFYGTKAEEETSLMFRNLPNDQTRDQLAALLDAEGFAGFYDFLYLPWDFKNFAGLGYAFVNFIQPAYAVYARSHFNGFTQWGVASEKVCEVCSTDRRNGLEAHVEFYRNSPLMRPGVPEICRPLLLWKGVRIEFPPPTKPLKEPRKKRWSPCHK